MSLVEDEDGGPLHFAAANGSNWMLELYLRRKFNPNQLGTRMRMTPLQVAARHGHTVACELLMQWDADKDAVDKDKATAMQWAAYGGYVKTVECVHRA